jgi:hypothetical protein
LWSPSCSAKSCGGAPISVIYIYIYQPPAPHSIERQRKEGCAFRAYILALNGEVLRANLINLSKMNFSGKVIQYVPMSREMVAEDLTPVVK